MKLAWVAAVALAGAIGLGAGALGLVGRPAPTPAEVPLVGAVAARIPALDCPAGEIVATLGEGDRVLVVARSVDGDYLAVRRPGAAYETVWVRSAAVDAGPSEARLTDASLPVASCVTP